jgi:integrase
MFRACSGSPYLEPDDTALTPEDDCLSWTKRTIFARDKRTTNDWGEIKPFDKEQVRVLLNTARESQPRLYALYVLGVTAGLRQSELIGLQWGELDLSGGRLTVKRSVFKGKVSTPKTARGSRTVKLTGLAVDALIRTSTGIVTFGYSPRATVRRLIAPTSTNTIGVDCWKMRGFRVHRFTLALGTLALPCC